MPGNSSHDQSGPKRGFTSIRHQDAYFSRIAKAASPSHLPEEHEVDTYDHPWYNPFSPRADNPRIKDMCDAYIVELKRHSKGL